MEAAVCLLPCPASCVADPVKGHPAVRAAIYDFWRCLPKAGEHLDAIIVGSLPQGMGDTVQHLSLETFQGIRGAMVAALGKVPGAIGNGRDAHTILETVCRRARISPDGPPVGFSQFYLVLLWYAEATCTAIPGGRQGPSYGQFIQKLTAAVLERLFKNGSISFKEYSARVLTPSPLLAPLLTTQPAGATEAQAVVFPKSAEGEWEDKENVGGGDSGLPVITPRDTTSEDSPPPTVDPPPPTSSTPPITPLAPAPLAAAPLLGDDTPSSAQLPSLDGANVLRAIPAMRHCVVRKLPPGDRRQWDGGGAAAYGQGTPLATQEDIKHNACGLTGSPSDASLLSPLLVTSLDSFRGSARSRPSTAAPTLPDVGTPTPQGPPVVLASVHTPLRSFHIPAVVGISEAERLKVDLTVSGNKHLTGRADEGVIMIGCVAPGVPPAGAVASALYPQLSVGGAAVQQPHASMIHTATGIALVTTLLAVVSVCSRKHVSHKGRNRWDGRSGSFVATMQPSMVRYYVVKANDIGTVHSKVLTAQQRLQIKRGVEESHHGRRVSARGPDTPLAPYSGTTRTQQQHAKGITSVPLEKRHYFSLERTILRRLAMKVQRRETPSKFSLMELARAQVIPPDDVQAMMDWNDGCFDPLVEVLDTTHPNAPAPATGTAVAAPTASSPTRPWTAPGSPALSTVSSALGPPRAVLPTAAASLPTGNPDPTPSVASLNPSGQRNAVSASFTSSSLQLAGAFLDDGDSDVVAVSYDDFDTTLHAHNVNDHSFNHYSRWTGLADGDAPPPDGIKRPRLKKVPPLRPRTTQRPHRDDPQSPYIKTKSILGGTATLGPSRLGHPDTAPEDSRALVAHPRPVLNRCKYGPGRVDGAAENGQLPTDRWFVGERPLSDTTLLKMQSIQRAIRQSQKRTEEILKDVT